MTLTSKHNPVKNHKTLCASNNLASNDLWYEIPEETQANIQGGNNERIRVRLEPYDHLTWAMSLMF